jgi:hypothetical protein
VFGDGFTCVCGFLLCVCGQASSARRALDGVLVEVEVGALLECLVSDVCEAAWVERHATLSQVVLACQEQVCVPGA